MQLDYYYQLPLTPCLSRENKYSCCESRVRLKTFSTAAQFLHFEIYSPGSAVKQGDERHSSSVAPYLALDRQTAANRDQV